MMQHVAQICWLMGRKNTLTAPEDAVSHPSVPQENCTEEQGCPVPVLEGHGPAGFIRCFLLQHLTQTNRSLKGLSRTWSRETSETHRTALKGQGWTLLL